ncbi:MAG: TIGR04211 family SH3 domain-containing protein [Deltaproteobacteria bacterium]|uniref:TIGR04211 family SH3 domain-containing protein n=1 Tax=Desulfobacula sp. TaxID=2593537 RepID=UPI0019BB924C|nr:TIGR04211 family SH3 domain-containing protein [Candidatus Desulfobacula maris]MBL6994975.1 TIGR04211 family SH3 domain-containing protein [Desulfobacula sp.]
MKKSLFYFMIFFTILCLFPQLIWARTGYVSDRLILNLRQEPDNVSAVIKGLKSDTHVFILDENKEFYKIELESKETGWVEKKFIIFELPKTLIIDQLTQENNDLKDKISKLGFLETDLKPNEGTLPADQDIKHDGLIENAENIQKIVQENQMYQKKIMELSKELELLKKNDDPLKIGMIKWFLAGVGVLLMGWIVGRSVSSRKRKSNSLLN